MSHRHQHKPSRIGTLPRWQRVSSYLAFSLCALAGLGYLLAHELHWQALAGQAHALLVAHGVGAYLTVLMVGAVMPLHIRSAWNARRNRGSGIAIAAVMAALAVSGLLLYYGSEESHEATLWAHWLLGGGMVTALPLHIVLGRMANRRRVISAGNHGSTLHGAATHGVMLNGAGKGQGCQELLTP